MSVNYFKSSLLLALSTVTLGLFSDDYFKFNTLLLCVFATLCLLSEQVYAFEEDNPKLNLKQLLLMPGDLTQGHAKIESKCQKCHLHFDKENQSPLCLDCHEDIDNDLKEKRGFHSNIAKDEIKQCNKCHTDHKGREFDITSLDKAHFDHDQTEFRLEDSHLSLTCIDCHDPKDKNFRLTLEANQCLSCHEDPHQGKLKDDCSQCHEATTWQETTFDHSTTDFLLEAKHQDLACQSCHVNDVAQEIGTECVTCHLSKDKHLNTFGDKCQSCHSEKGWDETQYDHFKETKFRLLGKHQSLSCESCHAITDLPNEKNTNRYNITQDEGKEKRDTSCNSCHLKDDVHLGNNGSDCQQCHNNEDWNEARFDHDKETNFVLKGAHKNLVCAACHLPQSFKAEKSETTDITKNKQKLESRTCNDCHKITDVHEGNLGTDCQSCHQQEQWHEDVSFNHDFTLFPLTGAHQMQVCQTCHFSNDFSVEQFACIDCHEEDDVHQNVFGNKCQQCHNSASWSAWRFDHQTQTDYSLDGTHENLSCSLCHNSDHQEPLNPQSQCIACHQSDDIHLGAFGSNCQQCHNTESFNDFKH